MFFSVGDGSDCSMVDGFAVKVPTGEDPIEVALAALVGGPTEEEEAEGASSFFSTGTAEVITSISLVDGLLLIDFVDVRSDLENASTSCGSEALLSQLNATALQHPNVERVRYSIVGSCSVFSNWLQRQCTEYSREGATVVELSVVEMALGSGCVPGATQLPDGIWFGYLAEVSETMIEFDLACWFSGAPAAEAAAQDGEESPPPNDYYVRNSTELDRSLEMGAGAEVVWLPDVGDPATVTRIEYSAWLVEREAREFATRSVDHHLGWSSHAHRRTVRPLAGGTRSAVRGLPRDGIGAAGRPPPCRHGIGVHHRALRSSLTQL